MAVKAQRKATAPASDPEVEESDQDEYVRLFEQYATIVNQVDLMKERQDKIKADIMSFLEEHGERDENGSLIIPLPHPIKYRKKEVNFLKRERRSSSTLDEDRAEEMLARKGLLERCQKTITVLDPDEIYVLYQEDQITEEELDDLFEERITWAFVPFKGA